MSVAINIFLLPPVFLIEYIKRKTPCRKRRDRSPLFSVYNSTVHFLYVHCKAGRRSSDSLARLLATTPLDHTYIYSTLCTHPSHSHAVQNSVLCTKIRVQEPKMVKPAWPAYPPRKWFWSTCVHPIPPSRLLVSLLLTAGTNKAALLRYRQTDRQSR